MRKDVVTYCLLVAGLAAITPIVIDGVIAVAKVTRKAAIVTIDHIKFERDMHKGIKEGRIIKHRGEYYTVIEDGTLE